jgi:hypothetical protein
MSLLEKSSSMELSRRTQPFFAKKQSYTLGQQVQIEVDVQREFLDFENSRLVFEVQWTKNTDNFSTPAWIASQFVKNLRVKTLAGQMIGHEIREYRAWCNMYKELNGKAGLNASYSDVLEGATARAFTATTTVQYAHKFMTHIFSIKEYYPAHFHQGIMIEFDLPGSNTELAKNDDTDVVANLPTFEITCIKYVADLVQLKPEIENEMVQLMEQQRLFADYQEVLTQDNQVSAGGTSNYDLVGIDGRVKSIYQYQVGVAARAGTANSADAYYWPALPRNGLTNYRFKLGANYLNYESISVGSDKRAEQVYELLKAFDKHESGAYHSQLDDAGLSYTKLETENFVIGVKVDKAMKDSDKTISSMVDKDRNNVRVELTVVTLDATSYTQVLLDKRIQILPGSILRSVRS